MPLRHLFLASIATLAGIAVSVLWIDRPLARFLSGFHLGQAVFTSSPVTLPVMIVLAYAGLLLGLGYLIAGRKQPKWVEAAMLAGIAVLVGQWLAHGLLKPLFGRTVPSIYLQTGLHGFHWFHRGRSFGSFPSGHATEAAALLSVVWAFYPRWRWAYGVTMALVAGALMLGQWHYLERHPRRNRRGCYRRNGNHIGLAEGKSAPAPAGRHRSAGGLNRDDGPAICGHMGTAPDCSGSAGSGSRVTIAAGSVVSGRLRQRGGDSPARICGGSGPSDGDAGRFGGLGERPGALPTRSRGRIPAARPARGTSASRPETRSARALPARPPG